MTTFTQLLLSTLALTLTLLFLLWLLSLARRDASIVDPFWGSGFVSVAWAAVTLTAPANPRALLLAGLVTLWGLRLSVFLLWRNWGHGEDYRYRTMREHHGPRFAWVSLFTVFLLQGIILWFVAFPILATATATPFVPLGWLDLAGGLLWGIGLCFETLGDWQLARFKADPAHAGQVLDSGLWRYTRHPNYFGDFCVWWGIYLVALAGGGWWTVGSPLLMSVLLLKVSGVSLLESTIRERRPDYAAYQSRTNAFFPGPSRNTTSNCS